MKKKIMSAMTIIALGLFYVFPVNAATDSVHIIDVAELLTDAEEEQLESKLDQISEKQDCDLAIVTIESLEGNEASVYADYVYEEVGYGIGADLSGALLLISKTDRKWAISTSGFGITAFTDAGQEYLINTLKEDLSEGNYAEFFLQYADLCDDFLTQAHKGTPYDVTTLPEENPSMIINIGISVLLGFLFASITMQQKKSEMKTVRAEESATNYVTAQEITKSRDVFLYHQVSRVAKPKDQGSTTHTSSLGSTHGGSSGSF